jgi:predicted short-subunit dehydrogenase-like oxidoreductase (DUF2520 family)
MRVAIIGSGNVATVMGRKIRHAGHVIQQVYSRNAEHAKHLAEQLDAPFSASEIDSGADLYIVAISDNSLHGIHEWLKLGDKLVVHTAGSVPVSVLEDVSANYGILYPLQTLRKELNTNTILPVLVDANNEYNRSMLFTFARSFADQVAYADDVQRSKLHLAAVIANNFSNYLFTLAEEYCEKEQVDFKMIVPLLEETAKRMNYASPGATQTGPAIRKDLKTISKHLEMLADYPELRKIYEIFTAEIMSTYSGR